MNNTMKSKIRKFEATIEQHGKQDAAYVSIPFDVKEIYGTKGRVKVMAKFDGIEHRGSIVNMGTGSHILILTKEVRNSMGKSFGEIVQVTVEVDTNERIVDIPPELGNFFKSHLQEKGFFDSLSYTNRKEYANWIREAKKAETKERRLNSTIKVESKEEKSLREIASLGIVISWKLQSILISHLQKQKTCFIIIMVRSLRPRFYQVKF